MKPIQFTSFVILSVSTLHTNAQKLDTTVRKEIYKIDKKLLLQKPAKSTVSPWALLGTGSVSTGISTMKIDPNNSGSNSRNTKFLMLGLSAVGASIPLFIASAKNKK